MIGTILLSLLPALPQEPSPGDDPAEVPRVRAQRIWDRAPHCAFGDLIHFGEHFLCTFREGSGHVPGTNGVIRVLASTDGSDWRSIALLVEEGIDLRDPKLSLMPSGRLMLSCGGSDYSDGLQEWHTRVAFSDDGQRWTTPRRVRGIPSNNWFFRITWQGEIGYCMPFVCGAEPDTGRPLRDQRRLRLYSTRDGMNYAPVSGWLDLAPAGGEATFRFDDSGVLRGVVRRASKSSDSSLIEAAPPYTDFQVTTFQHGLGGPNLLMLDDGSLLVGTRETEDQRPEGRSGNATVLLHVAPDGRWRRLFEFESGGDTSYPGFLRRDGTLWVLYYSSHQGSAAVYLARIPWTRVLERLEEEDSS